MNKRKTGFMALAVAVLLVGCATGFKATHDHDPANDFTAYKTFTWISEHPMTVGATDRIPNPMLESRIMVTVESALGTKGYRLIPDAASADFVLAFTAKGAIKKFFRVAACGVSIVTHKLSLNTSDNHYLANS